MRAKFITNSLHINCRDLFAPSDPSSLQNSADLLSSFFCMYIFFMLVYIVQASRYLASAKDKQQAPLATGSPVSSTSSWHSAFDPPSQTISPKRDKKRHKDVISKKSKKKKKIKKSQKTSHTLRQSQSTAQPSNAVSGVQMESHVPEKQDFDDPVFDLLCKNKEESPANQTHPPGYTGRGAAKMMARSGLRCQCHYVRRHLGPVKLLVDEFGFTPSTSASV